MGIKKLVPIFLFKNTYVSTKESFLNILTKHVDSMDIIVYNNRTL